VYCFTDKVTAYAPCYFSLTIEERHTYIARNWKRELISEATIASVTTRRAGKSKFELSALLSHNAAIF
jgi:hypothetical protein